MGNVEAAVAGVVLMLRRTAVAVNVVAVEVARQRDVGVSADAQAVAAGVAVNAVGGRRLRTPTML